MSSENRGLESCLREGKLSQLLFRDQGVQSQVKKTGMLLQCGPWPEHRPPSREERVTVNLSLKETHHK